MNERDPVILVVEDDDTQRKLLEYNINVEGFSVITAESGDEALKKFKTHIPDLVLLDWMIPGINGINFCKIVKGAKDTRHIPLLMISARIEDEDKVKGLDAGADDYVIKPYSVSELMARIRALLRRTRPTLTRTILKFKDIELDPMQHRVTRRGVEIELRPTEYRLLEVLIEHPGRVWSRQQLLDRVWGRNIFVEDRTVDVHVGRLRKALNISETQDHFRTVRGVGYSLG